MRGFLDHTPPQAAPQGRRRQKNRSWGASPSKVMKDVGRAALYNIYPWKDHLQEGVLSELCTII